MQINAAGRQAGNHVGPCRDIYINIYIAVNVSVEQNNACPACITAADANFLSFAYLPSFL